MKFIRKFFKKSKDKRSDFEKLVDEIERSRNDFWKKEYPKMSLEEKKKYWLASTHKGMRTQGEALADEYSQFSKRWYDNAKSREPKFDEIFQYVTENLGFEFDLEEYYKRIKQ